MAEIIFEQKLRDIQQEILSEQVDLGVGESQHNLKKRKNSLISFVQKLDPNLEPTEFLSLMQAEIEDQTKNLNTYTDENQIISRRDMRVSLLTGYFNEIGTKIYGTNFMNEVSQTNL